MERNFMTKGAPGLGANSSFWIRLAVLVLCVGAVYIPAYYGQFVWDDTVLVRRNPLVTGELTLSTLWFHTDFPLTILALWLQWLAAGPHPALYHGVTVAFHVLATVLLWRVLVLVRDFHSDAPNPRDASFSGRTANLGPWAGALLFGIHPVGAASAGWISEQKNTLSMVFYLASFALYLLFLQKQNRLRFGWYAASLMVFLLALFSKTSTVMLPFTLLLAAWWLGKPVRWRLLASVLPFFVLSLAFGLMTVWFEHHQTMNAGALPRIAFGAKLAMAGMAVWFYLWKDFLPIHLSMIYPLWHVTGRNVLSYLPGCALLLLILLCWKFRTRRWSKALLALLLLYVLNLLPVLGFLDMYYLALSRVSDHFQYISLAVFASGAGFLLFARRRRTAGPMVFGCIAFAFAALTWQRLEVITKDETLWESVLQRNPASWTANNNLGCIRAEQGKLDEAIQEFKRSLESNPRNAAAHANLGKALAATRDFAGAEQEFNTAVRLKSTDADINNNFARLLLQEGKIDETRQLLESTTGKGRDISSLLLLARMDSMQHKTADAEAAYREILRRNPATVEALNNLAWLLATSADEKLRNGPDAVRHAERACELTRFQEAQPMGTLAAAYAEAGRFPQAVETARKAADLAEAAGNTGFAAANRQLLRLYQSGEPFHQH
ncbi:MAG TPA: tetratricopeptide repeat protein [Verrucomicrobiae bacterium]|nr:tetratricopeptide repeat protein [Verrucomicrobiae bacterium]